MPSHRRRTSSHRQEGDACVHMSTTPAAFTALVAALRDRALTPVTER